MTLSIIKEPDPRLNKISSPLSEEEFNSDLINVFKEMSLLMEQHDGVGLAAPQVGILKRFFIAKINNQIMFFGNPIIKDEDNIKVSGPEGCLSVPGSFSLVPRSRNLKLEYRDINGKEQSLDLKDIHAVIAQHEIDHLNGVTLYLGFSKLKKSEYLKGLRDGSY